ncbi:male sterility protein-domain-containing protein [Dipodascopsis uninucleata]
MKSFITLPLYHNHGISSFFRAVYSGKEISFFNAKMPLTSSNLVASMSVVGPDLFYGVPYALKLLGESPEGVKCLKSCKLVLFGGSSCPQELGDRLVEAGVNLVGHYGSTETGQLMTSFRPDGDKEWSYLRVPTALEPYLLMEETSEGSNIYECVVLDGWKSKVTSNSDNPKNSFRTKDLFAPHPTIPKSWRYLGRIDDRVTLMNGEKVLPIPIEHRIRNDPLVKECIVVGVGKSVPGLFVIASSNAAGMSEYEILDGIWPSIEDANSRAEAFSQLAREMVRVLPEDANYPRTDKGTIIRAAFYKTFETEIEELYNRFENQPEGTLSLSIPELESYLLDIFRKTVGIQLEDRISDFYQYGVDSLQAIRVWSILRSSLDFSGHGSKLSQNVIFENPNVQELAKHLYKLRIGDVDSTLSDIDAMNELYNKYKDFKPHKKGTIQPEGETILLTGATGSLGAHLLSQLINLNNVRMVYCLVRAESQKAALDRVLKSLETRYLTVSESNISKIVAYSADFSRSDLGLPAHAHNELINSMTKVIHAAWAVNFNINVRSFEKQHIAGAHNLIQFCLDVKTIEPSQFYFCSSISTAAGTPLPATIAEAPIRDFAHAQNMGYARSKLVTEHIVENAALTTGIHSRVLRIGQIVGDSVNGIWNDTEAIPLMIRSALVLHALPDIDEIPSWLPVDYVATAILDISGITGSLPNDTPETVYHLTNPKTFRWTLDLLPALRDSGLEFSIVPQRKWIDMLRKGEQDPVKNPTVKLLNFFADKYDNDKVGRRGLVFQTEITENSSKVMKELLDPVSEGLIQKFVGQWLRIWRAQQ